MFPEAFLLHAFRIPRWSRAKKQERAREAISPDAPKGMPSSATSLMSSPPIPPFVARETESRSRKPDKNPRALCSMASGKAIHGQAYAASGRERRHQGRKASRAALRILWCL